MNRMSDYRNRHGYSVEYLLCLNCQNLPEAGVYQCAKGHLFCNDCYFKLEKCLQCSHPLEMNQPIRNTYFENVILGLGRFECTFNVKGCPRKVPRELVEQHESECCYNVQKFGHFVNLCELLGDPECQFKVNNGNASKAVDHLVSFHHCILSTDENFLMEFQGFDASLKRSNTPGTNKQFWSPIILDLVDKQGYLLNVALFNKTDDTMALLSIFLPNSNFKGDIYSWKPDFGVEYRLIKEDDSEEEDDIFKFNLTQDPITLPDAAIVLSNSVSGLFQKTWLKSNVVQNRRLLINCQVIEKTKSGNDFGAMLEFEEALECSMKKGIFPTTLSTDGNQDSNNAGVKSKKSPDEWEVKKIFELSNVNAYPKNWQVIVKNFPHFVTKQILYDTFFEFGDIVGIKFWNHIDNRHAIIVFKETSGARLVLECAYKIFVRKQDSGEKRRLVIEAIY